MNYNPPATFLRSIRLVLCVAILLVWSCGRLPAQETNRWRDLADVRYLTSRDSLLGYEVELPVFGTRVKALEGKRIMLKGYMVPLDELRGHQYFVLSALPYNLCFFCGGGGPETVIEIHSDEDIPYSTSPFLLSGILELNPNDPFHLMYILQKVTVVKE